MLENSLLASIYQDLGIPESWPTDRGVQIYEQADVKDLEIVEIDFTGKLLVLRKDIIPAWRKLQQAATNDGLQIKPFSGFRSYLYQKTLITAQLQKGRELDEILTNLAAPGCSEHHTGRALDLTACNCPPLGEEFENTAEFKWLTKYASDFNFVMSFPRDNQYGYIYEPWHWCFLD